jgi:hypothetical protein
VSTSAVAARQVRGACALSALLLVAGFGPTAWAQQTVPEPDSASRPRLTARRAAGPITLDGRLDEPDWHRAPVAKDFVTVRPDYVPGTKYPSEVRVLFDDEHLYIGAFNRDSAGLSSLRMPDLRRDFSSMDSDVFGVTFGPLGDGRTAFQLQVTPLGSQGDVQAFDGGASFSFSWDAMWRVRTSRADSGWVAEIAIPWTSLRYAKGLESWDINFVRNTRRAAQWSAWVPYPRQFSSWRLSYSGLLDSIQPPPPRANLRTRLYGLTESSRTTAPGGFTGTTGDVGGELIWAPTANSLFEATVNTDFAQADVDRQVVNLTRFSVFFPEQRQFFLENADLLTAASVSGSSPTGGTANPFVVQPFFSRRIGLGLDGTPRPIVGGARYGYRTGRTAVGALAMRQGGIGTDEMDAADFGVARASQFLGRSTRIGGLIAYRDGARGGDGTNVVSAVDMLTRFGEQVQLSAMVSRSAQGGETGTAATWSLNHRTPRSSLGLAGAFVNDRYAPRTGFVSRPNVLMTNPSVDVTFQPAWRPAGLVWIRPELFTLFFHDPTSKALQEARLLLNTEVLAITGGTVTPFVEHNLQRPVNDVALLPGVTIAPGAYDYSRFGLDIKSDQSAPLAVSARLSAGGFFNGTQEQAVLAGRWSPNPYLSVRASYEINGLRALGTADTSLITHLVGPELRASLSPRVHWSAFYQYNTVQRSGALNARFSWEFAPLSFFYIVYNDGQPILDGLMPRSRSLIVKLSWLKQL